MEDGDMFVSDTDTRMRLGRKEVLLWWLRWQAHGTERERERGYWLGWHGRTAAMGWASGEVGEEKETGQAQRNLA